jgi:hypothetical protein
MQVVWTVSAKNRARDGGHAADSVVILTRFTTRTGAALVDTLVTVLPCT